MSPTNATLGGSNPNMNGIMSPSIVPQNNIGITLKKNFKNLFLNEKNTDHYAI